MEVLGVGSCIRNLSKEHLTAALKTATGDVKQIEKARILGEEIRAEKGVANAIECIYRDLVSIFSPYRPFLKSESEAQWTLLINRPLYVLCIIARETIGLRSIPRQRSPRLLFGLLL
jgi:hypothetical protein